MAFTAGYWSLASHRPTRLCFLGCNMNYSQNGPTHFYGKGQPDPLRDDITLTSLRACSYRMLILAKMQGCDIVSLSTGETNLHVPQTSFEEFLDYRPAFIISREKMNRALKYEKNLQKPAKTCKNMQKPPTTCKNLQKPAKTCKNLQKLQNTSNNLQKPPKTSKNIRKPPKTSKNPKDCQRPPKTSKNLHVFR